MGADELKALGAKLRALGSRLSAGVKLPLLAAADAALKAAKDFEDAFGSR